VAFEVELHALLESLLAQDGAIHTHNLGTLVW
jgi:hypothetical protein